MWYVAGASDPVGAVGLELGGGRVGAAGAVAHGVRGRPARHAQRLRARHHHERPLLRGRLCRSAPTTPTYLLYDYIHLALFQF